MVAAKLHFEEAIKKFEESKQEIRFLRNMNVVEILRFVSNPENLKKANEDQKSYIACVGATHDSSETIRSLHEVGFDLSKPFDNGWGVATSAARSGSVNVIKTLSDLGINLAKPDQGFEGEKYVGRTPATVGARMKNLNVLAALHEVGVDIIEPDGSGKTSLDIIMKYAKASEMMGIMCGIERIIKGQSQIDQKDTSLTLVPTEKSEPLALEV